LSLHLMGVSDQLLPYQGSKRSVRKKLRGVLEQRGLTELRYLHLNDVGSWGTVWEHLVARMPEVLVELRALNEEDPRAVYDRLHRAPTPASHLPAFAAQFLFLQRLSHSGKAVGVREGCWSSPGFNKTSAYGVAGTDRFGEVKPMIPALIRRLEEGIDWPEHTWMTQHDAQVVSAHYINQARANGETYGRSMPFVLYIDPPYLGSTRYPDGHLERSQVIHIARCMQALGAIVIISEAEPVDALVAEGWASECLKNPPGHSAPFRAKGAEWITISPEAA
jgi:hypothetical protein